MPVVGGLDLRIFNIFKVLGIYMPTRDKDDKSAIEHSVAAGVKENNVVSAHRRKLIKASVAAVPAIMTIRSGAAVALTSINQCLTADALKVAQEPPAPVLANTDALDEWVRVRGVKVTKNDAAGTSTTYFCVEQTPGVWECWDTDGVPAAVTIGTDEIKNGEKVNLLGYFDGVTGNYTFHPKSLYMSDGLASPISYSCLCSLHPEMDVCNWG